MELSLLSIALAGLVLTQTPTHEVVVLPLRPVEVPEATSVEAWEQTFLALERAGREGGLLFRKHRAGRRALYNVRRQIYDCADNPSCLHAFAQSLGAAWVVTGRVSAKSVRLELYDLESGRLILGTESTPEVAAAGHEAQVKAAVSGLLAELPRARAAMPQARAEASGTVGP